MRYLLDYDEPMDPETAEMIAGSAHRSPEAIRAAIAGFAEIGVHELSLDPTAPAGASPVQAGDRSCLDRSPASDVDGTVGAGRHGHHRPFRPTARLGSGA
jgi:hypothetical protein